MFKTVIDRLRDFWEWFSGPIRIAVPGSHAAWVEEARAQSRAHHPAGKSRAN